MAPRWAAESAAHRPALGVFMPDRLSLVKGPPSGRRAHLDGFCAALWPSRAETRRRYSRALAQRNALLSRVRSGAASESALEAWDLELASSGVALIADRTEAVGRLAPAFVNAAAGLGLDHEPTIRYRPRSAATVASTLAAELSERRGSDVARGYTGWGPHLDELSLEASGRSLRRYGSQGQQRTALLALLFAERQALLDDGRPPPLMLLDDVSSELDSEHRNLLVEHLAEGGGQALVTATEPDQVPRRADRHEVAVRDGRPLTSAPEQAGGVSRQARPRALADAVRVVRDAAEPPTLLAAVQSAWRPAVGERIACEARPVRERDGIVTVSCCAATWAQELDLLQGELLERLNRALAPRRISSLRFRVGDEPPEGAD